MYLDTKLTYYAWNGSKDLIAWLARTPDLTNLDSFTWGHVKIYVFPVQTWSQSQMKQRIEQGNAAIILES